LIPEEPVRLGVLGAGAEWIWQPVPALFPQACQGRAYAHWAAYRHTVAKAQYADPFRAHAWTEAPLTRLSLGKVGQVRGGLRRMPPAADEALQALDHCWVYLNAQRRRTH
jgi:hypothetical protein